MINDLIMRIETEIANFRNLFQEYDDIQKELENLMLKLNEISNIQEISQVKQELNNFDTKLRMALAINRIDLNQEFMQKKIGDLRLCHLMFYKFADIWFAYESFFDLYELINKHKIQSKVVWLNNKKYSNYKNIEQLSEA